MVCHACPGESYDAEEAGQQYSSRNGEFDEHIATLTRQPLSDPAKHGRCLWVMWPMIPFLHHCIPQGPNSEAYLAARILALPDKVRDAGTPGHGNNTLYVADVATWT